MNPDTECLELRTNKEPLTFEEWKTRRGELVEKRIAALSSESGEESQAELAEDPNIQQGLAALYASEMKLEPRRYEIEKAKMTSLYKVIEWVHRTVSKDLMTTAMTLVVAETEGLDDIPLKLLIKALKEINEPSRTSTIEDARKTYRDVLFRATQAGVKPEQWILEWTKALHVGMAYKISELEGIMGVKDFLKAVESRIEPTWARHQLDEVNRREDDDEEVRSLTKYGKWLNMVIAEHGHTKKNAHVFTTQAAPRDHRASRGGRGGGANRGSRAGGGGAPRARYVCVCGSEHPWKPEDCGKVQLALTGSTNYPLRDPLSNAKKTEVRRAVYTSQWRALRTILESKGWLTPQGGSGKPLSDDPVVITVIDPSLWKKELSVFSTVTFGKHKLFDSTVIDNCGALHLVNHRDKLVPGSFIPSIHYESVESGTTSFPISGRGKRVIEKVLTGPAGPKTVDLVLTNVAVIDNFHVNIVSEALMTKSGIWYCGLDTTLRRGPLGSSTVICELTREHNITFLQYKPLYTYEASQLVNVSIACTVINAVFKVGIRRKREHVPGYVTTREDSEELWHLRSGHLGPLALQALVKHARGVKITGTKRIECEKCSVAHASQLISRKRSERRSPRPFWRISWDLFDYPQGIDGSNWVLVIRCEYSGKLWVFVLKTKTLEEVFTVLENFERWVKRQYGLMICVIRQDNDTGTIAFNGETRYQRWIIEQGIVLELPPSHTHEPNGGVERAGKEIIEKAIAMLLAANLPWKLWPEVVQAAAYLFNMSPNERNDLHSPNEVLDLWFRQYFRWYDVLQVREATVDLRPSWKGIYAYGCKAYPLIKSREAGQRRRMFKVEGRAHIGYLVGYKASNIYRIWVPQLHRVISTRNVRFNEQEFYEPKDEKKDAIPIPVASEMVELLHTPDEIADAGTVLDALQESAQTGEPLNQEATGQSTVDELGDAQTPQEGRDSGVEAAGATTPQLDGSSKLDSAAPGLPTPESSVHSPVEDVEDSFYSASERSATTPTPSAQSRVQEDVQDTIVVAGSDSLNGSGSFELQEQSEEVASTQDSAEELQAISEESLPPPEREDQARQEVDSTGKKTEETDSSGAQTRTRAARARERDSSPDVLHTTEVTMPRAPLRRSSRIVGKGKLRPETQSRSVNAVFAFTEQMYQEHEISIPSDRFWNIFLTTYLPDQQRIVQEGDRAHHTMHAVVAAAVGRDKAERLGASPTRKVHRDDLLKPPKNWKELLDHPLRDLFLDATKLEIHGLKAKQVWEEIARSAASGQLLPLKWVFSYKFDEDGFLESCKARVVVRGDMQDTESLQSTYAATLAARSLRLVMALCAFGDLETFQFDIKQAFLNAQRSGAPVFCELPEGFKKEGRCVRVDRALYGLKDSPLLWYREFSSTLKELGLEASLEEPCLFFDRVRKILLIFYVDDFIVLFAKESKKEAEKLIAGIKAKYELHELGEVNSFLGIRVIRDRAKKKVWLTHDQYIEKIANKFGVADSATFPSIPLPGTELVKNPDQATKARIKFFQELVGSILYTAIMIRVDVAFAAAKLSQFLTNPSEEHITAALQVIRYLYLTRYLAIEYGGDLKGAQMMVIASDASFADDSETRRSSHGFVMMLFGGVIHWRAARQDTITTSSTEAELLALSHTAKETMAIERLVRELKADLGTPWTIFCDNIQTIRLVVGDSERLSTKLRHVDIHNMWVRQEHAKGSFEIAYLPTGEMPADGLTKQLPRQKFEHFRNLLNLQSVEHLVTGSQITMNK